MICSASCRKRVCTRCESASAVCFIGPHRPSCIIENDMSTHSATAATEPPLRLGHLEVLDEQLHPAVCRCSSRAAGADVRAASSGAFTRSGVALQGVRDGAHRVDGQLVAELPLAGEPGRLVGLARGAVVVVSAAGRVDLLEDPAERGLAEAADGARGEPQAVVAAGDVALSLELALELAQRLHVAWRRRRRGTARAARRRRRRGSRRSSPARAVRCSCSRSASSATAPTASP